MKNKSQLLFSKRFRCRLGAVACIRNPGALRARLCSVRAQGSGKEEISLSCDKGHPEGGTNAETSETHLERVCVTDQDPGGHSRRRSSEDPGLVLSRGKGVEMEVGRKRQDCLSWKESPLKISF